MMKNIVILHFADDTPSGVVRYVEMLEQGLCSHKGIKLYVICLHSNTLFCKMYSIDECVKIQIPFFAEPNFFKHDTYIREQYFTAVADIVSSYLHNERISIWHVQELFMVKLAKKLSLKNGGVIISHLHIIPWKFSYGTNQKYFNLLYKQKLEEDYSLISKNELERNAYSLTDKIICVSNCAKEHIIKAYGIDASKIEVIYNGLSPIPVKNKIYNSNLCEILFVGRISNDKGILFLLNALKKVKNRGYDFSLNLVGKTNGTTKDLIFSQYGDLNINMCGEMTYNQVQKMYSCCTIGVVPSLHEQCSYTAIEMMMFGVPMIVSDVDALSEMFEHEINALKIPLVFDEDFGLTLNEDKLADSIIRLMENQELREELGKNARENYYRNFTLEYMIENTINVYEKC